MQSFTTQSHQRNYQGNVVVENPNCAVGYQNRKHQSHKVLFGITTSVMALAVAVTGTLWGATAIHNHQLKSQLHTLQTQATQVVATIDDYPAVGEMLPDGANYYTPTTSEDEEQAPKPQENAHREHAKRRAHRRPPISDKQHAVQPLPSINHNHSNNQSAN